MRGFLFMFAGPPAQPIAVCERSCRVSAFILLVCPFDLASGRVRQRGLTLNLRSTGLASCGPLCIRKLRPRDQRKHRD